MGSLLGELGPLDDVLDVLLLISPLLVVAPPHWPLVFALESEMSARFATWLSFITLLSS
jgi:hypothetical protein